jgi:hypothetical protein
MTSRFVIGLGLLTVFGPASAIPAAFSEVPKNGPWKATLLVAPTQARQYEPIEVVLVVKNISPAPVYLALPEGLALLEERLELTVWHKGVAVPSALRPKPVATTPSVVFGGKSFTQLSPNQTYLRRLCLNPLFRIEQPGQYEVRGKFFASHHVEGQTVPPFQELEPVQFQVIAAEGDQSQREDTLIAQLRAQPTVAGGAACQLMAIESEKSLTSLVHNLPFGLTRECYESLVLTLSNLEDQRLATRLCAELASQENPKINLKALDVFQARAQQDDLPLLLPLLDSGGGNVRWGALRCAQKLLGIYDVNRELRSAPARDDPQIQEVKKLILERFPVKKPRIRLIKRGIRLTSPRLMRRRLVRPRPRPPRKAFSYRGPFF